jgi:hypothetical protein
MRGSRSLSATAVFVLLAASCSAPQYQYVRDTHTRTAFRVPTSWTIFDKAAVLGLPPGPQADVPDPIEWLVGIDGSPEASVSHVLDASDLASDQPQGIGLVRDLSFVERDSASIQYLRNFLFPVDNLIQNKSDAAVLSYDDTIDQNGYRGVQMVFQFRASALASATSGDASSSTGSTGDEQLQRALLGGQGVAVLSPDFVQVDQKAFIDPSSSKVYYVAILCSADCFQHNRDQIGAAVDSWTVIA